MNFKNNELKTVWYLEMLNKDELSETKLPKNASVIKLEIPLPAMNRFFYKEVGRLWNWTDRLSWSKEKWCFWAESSDLETWMLLFKGTPAGYFELKKGCDEVEIAYFGLLQKFLGKRLGGGFLSEAVKKAWELKKKRIWVHTCSLDHPNALGNYKSRGFKVYREINC